MIKRLTAYSTIALALCACSDEAYILPNGIGEDGSLDIRLAVPQMQQVATRATDEYAVSNLTMLVLSDGKVAQITEYSSSDLKSAGDNQYSLSVSIDAALRSATDLKFYFIANNPAADTDLALNMTETDIKGVTYTTVVNADETMPMCGSASLTDLTGGNSVALWRNAAKVTVQDGSVDEDGVVTEGDVYYDFSVFSTAGNAALLAGADQAAPKLGKATPATPLPSSVGSDEMAYVHPTENEGLDAENRPFTVLRAPYSGTEYYYRVDFRNKDEQGDIINLDIAPNHWYKIVVTAVNGAGATTVAEAAANPSPLVEATIYDVAPASYNIITDGTRELGVSHEVVYNGDPDGTADLFVKLYSPEDSEYPEATVDAWRTLISSSDSWISLTGVEDVSDNPLYAGEASGVEAGTKGRLYRLTLTFAKTASPGTLTTDLSVDWKGLNRTVPVMWVREFAGEDLCSVLLTIKDGSGATIENETPYWDFLKNVNGVGTEQNGGNIRNEGLHFPVMYGESGKLWTYEYVITYNEDIFNGAEYDWEIKTSGLTNVSVSPTSGTGKSGALEVKVTRTNTANDWIYETGELILYVKEADNARAEYTRYPLEMYHTGFFHDHTAKINDTEYSTSSYRVGGEPDATKPYYYYEVLTGPNGNHWLDRNLGATASGLYIEATGGVAYHGNSEAAGGYYRAAEYVNGGKPEMYAGLCPPGYEIPREEVWNSVRNSTSFDTSAVGNYYNAALRATNGMYIYFPKALYYAEGTKTGESRAGYYWSSTAASGLEKDQIGNWLRCLQISGNITTFINGQVEGRSNAQGYAMSVRCVGKTAASDETYRTSFNVIGATNVYLYSVNEDGSRNAVTTWPGKAIGNYATMTDGQMMYFAYESATTSSDKFYVIFSYKDSSGKIHTVSKAPDGSTLYSTNQNPANLTGWKVTGDRTVNGASTNLDGTWKVTDPTNNVENTNPNVYFNDSPFFQTTAGKITIYCWNVEGWDNMYCHYTYQGVTTYTKGTKLSNYWPQLYSYEIPETDVTRMLFASNTISNNVFTEDNHVTKVEAGAYYNNNDVKSIVNQILTIPEPAAGTWRIAIRPLFGEGKNHYLYDWDGTNAASAANSKQMTPLLSGKFYYYDVYSDCSGFLINDGKFSNVDNNGDWGHQTVDLNGKNYQEGELMEQWYGTISIK